MLKENSKNRATIQSLLFAVFLLLAGSNLYSYEIKSDTFEPKERCVLCGGRFLCGATDQVVELTLGQRVVKDTIANHCQAKTKQISEFLRLNQKPRSDEDVRYEALYGKLEKINNNMGGNMPYKLRSGILFSEFINLNKIQSRMIASEKESVIERSQTELDALAEQNAILPVLSQRDFSEQASSKPGEYQEYVLTLISTHPALLKKIPNTKIFRKSNIVDERVAGILNKSYGSLPSAELSAARASSGGGGESGKSAVGGSGSSKSNPSTKEQGPAKNVRLNQNGDLVYAEKAKPQDSNFDPKYSSKSGGYVVTNLSNFNYQPSAKSASSYYRDYSAPSFLRTVISNSSANTLCQEGINSGSQKYLKNASSELAKSYGSSNSYDQERESRQIDEKLNQALASGNTDNCKREMREIVTRDIYNLSNDSASKVASTLSELKDDGYASTVVLPSTPASPAIQVSDNSRLPSSVDTGLVASVDTQSVSQFKKENLDITRIDNGNIPGKESSPIENTSVTCVDWQSYFMISNERNICSNSNQKQSEVCFSQMEQDIKGICYSTFSIKSKSTKDCITQISNLPINPFSFTRHEIDQNGQRKEIPQKMDSIAAQLVGSNLKSINLNISANMIVSKEKQDSFCEDIRSVKYINLQSNDTAVQLVKKLKIAFGNNYKNWFKENKGTNTTCDQKFNQYIEALKEREFLIYDLEAYMENMKDEIKTSSVPTSKFSTSKTNSNISTLKSQDVISLYAARSIIGSLNLATDSEYIKVEKDISYFCKNRHQKTNKQSTTK